MDAIDDRINNHRLSATDHAIITCNRDEIITGWDRRAEQTFGWSKQEALEQNIFYLLLPPTPESMPKLTLTDIISTGEENQSEQFTLSRRAQHKNGSAFDAHFLIFNINESDTIIVLVRDLGRQQRFLEKINTSYHQQTILDQVLKISVQPLPLDQQLGKILDHLFSIPQLNLLPRGAVFLAEPDSDIFIVKTRRGFAEHSEMSCSELPQRLCSYGQSAQYDAVDVDSCTKSKSAANCRLAKPHGHFCSPVKKGKKVVGVLCLYTRKGHNSQPAFKQLFESICNIIAGMIESREMDLQLITLVHDLRHSIHEIKEEKKFSESIIQGLTHGLIVTDLDGNIHTYNELAESIMSTFTATLDGKNLIDVVGPDAAARLLDINHGNSKHLDQELTITSGHDGRKIIGYSVVPREDAHGNQVGRIISIDDISELKYVRKEMEKMNRLATVAEIASAVAHEVRNPLAGIKIMAQSIQGQSVTKEEQNECLTRIIRQVDRLNSLLTEFFSYARPAEPQIRSTSLLDIITETQHLIINKMVKNHIIFREDYQNVPPVVADPNQVQQVLLNLFLNAMDAIQQGGVIDLKTAHIKGAVLSNHRKKNPGLLPLSSYVTLSVADNGVGMTPEITEKVFEPFFTTKSTGTGLGLSIVYRTLRENSAAITVESTPKKGTTFTLYFSTGE
ncbi:ATP-binding protein [Desulfopila inferna]|uniref:ATP-binding protein n=1 Tax=Desulfopila inferna TaxID=468528 RepID=UPI0019630779|nr:ATP-binding protein [Desulfopila inferna]MBM9604814.1 PAS domain S-box protein [Desulfopila inferna]